MSTESFDASSSLAVLQYHAHRIGTQHGFTEASVAEDIALMHSELSEALEDHRDGKMPNVMTYAEKRIAYDDSGNQHSYEVHFAEQDERGTRKPCGIPSEMADVVVRILHFCGKHGVPLGQAITEKMHYNESRPAKHGGKVL